MTLNLTLRDLVPVVTAAMGFLVGGLHTTAANFSERRQARNAVLYSLLEMRHQIWLSNPRILLVAIGRVLDKRCGPNAASELAHAGARQLLYELFESNSAARLTSLTQRYADAVHALAPFYPLLAYRLLGDRALQLDGMIKHYYEQIRARPDVANDPQAPAILTIWEDRTLDIAFDKALEQLAEDVRRVAWRGWLYRYIQVIRVLHRQDTGMDNNLDAVLTEQMDRILEQFGPGRAPSNSTAAADATG